MTQVPAESQSWPKAGAADRASASGEQIADRADRGERASDAPPQPGAARGATPAVTSEAASGVDALPEPPANR